MFNKRVLIVSFEIILLIFVFLLIIWPMMSLFIWSIAETWYWPSTLPQKIGFDYWKQALGMQKSLAIGAVSIVPAFFLSLMIAVIVVVISMLIAAAAAAMRAGSSGKNARLEKATPTWPTSRS